MLSTKSLCFLVVLVANVAASEKGECAKQFNVDKPDFEELKKNPTEPAEKMLCFLKCEYEDSGVLNADKTVDADKLIAHVAKLKNLEETTKKNIKKCVQEMTVPVNSCSDIKPYYLCVHNEGATGSSFPISMMVLS
ncbi:uncharacterized protein LOC123319368 isoform X2 [Coccinella septempunctata]|uniref:uncharacterized protein LOC123319368 isoform X2 n=1 Tax=Coccinella septempunctata TaxID=41139 RepID=UPI001D08D880|nr:uncharacterized protein LOC123319368 isoform X2 [Coccinella septempunctata]